MFIDHLVYIPLFFLQKGENEKTMYVCVDEPERKIEEEIVTW
jgi:hypothetical protein